MKNYDKVYTFSSQEFSLEIHGKNATFMRTKDMLRIIKRLNIQFIKGDIFIKTFWAILIHGNGFDKHVLL